MAAFQLPIFPVQMASADAPGLVSNAAQTIAGAKTFSGDVTVSGTLSAAFTPHSDAIKDAGLVTRIAFASGAHTFTGGVADGGAAVAFTYNNSVTLAAAGSKIASWKNNGSEMMYLDKAGGLVAQGYLTGAGVSIPPDGYIVLDNVGFLCSIRYAVTKGSLDIGASITPSGDNTQDLGIPSYTWRNLYINKLWLPSTDSSGTPGAATINKTSGVSAIAAGASSVVITNNTAGATSRIFTQLETNDATATRLVVTKGSGTFTVSSLVNATGNTVFSWWVLS